MITIGHEDKIERKKYLAFKELLWDLMGWHKKDEE